MYSDSALRTNSSSDPVGHFFPGLTACNKTLLFFWSKGRTSFKETKQSTLLMPPKKVSIHGKTNIDTQTPRKKNTTASKFDFVPFSENFVTLNARNYCCKIQLVVWNWKHLFWFLAIKTYKCYSFCQQVWNSYIKYVSFEIENVWLDKAQDTKSSICTYSRNLGGIRVHKC